MIGDVFVNRKKLMATAVEVLQNEGKGRRHVFLDGRRLVGKTRVLRELAGELGYPNMVVLDLEPLVSTPVWFARNALQSFIGQITNRPLGPRYCREALGAVAETLPEEARQAVTSLMVQLEASSQDPVALVRAVLDLPQQIARGRGKPLVVAYDNFASLLNLKTYTELRRIDRIAEEVLASHDMVHYVLTGRNGQRLHSLMKRKSSFWNRKFSVLEVKPLNRYDTYFLASLIFGAEGRPIPRQVLPTVYNYSQGIPFYVEAICVQTLVQSKLLKEEITQHQVNRAFVLDVLLPGGRIHQACQRVLVESLSSVSGDNTLRGVLHALAVEEGRTLAAVARELDRPNGQVFGYLKSLQEADLLVLRHRRFFYRDPMLRFFVAQGLCRQPVEDELERRVVDDLARAFYEDCLLSRPGNDLTAQLRVKAISTEFEGLTLPGEPFGSPGQVLLPSEAAEEQLIDFDNEGTVLEEPAIIASDLMLRGRRKWMVEVETHAKPIGPDRLGVILKKRRFFENRYRMLFDKVWVVAEEGFTWEARQFARQNKMLITEGHDLDKLRQLIRQAATRQSLARITALQDGSEAARAKQVAALQEDVPRPMGVVGEEKQG